MLFEPKLLKISTVVGHAIMESHEKSTASGVVKTQEARMTCISMNVFG